MTIYMSRAWLLILLVVGSAMSQSEILVLEDQWDVADLATVRLEPHKFPMLPATVQTDLVLRGCTIPQPWLADTPENVIRGNFLASGENAWAVLCSRQLRSSVLVYVEGFEAPVELNPRADREFLQVVTPSGEIGYSRGIFTASPTYIQEKLERYGVPLSGNLDHDGIADAFLEKGSTVWYYSDGSWLQLPGSD